ncbi:MAG: protoporphyrinogen oxidase [Rhodothermales bacterium]|nr:protoporphyrinogen oxidase [Rhodothermales bacterium]
MSRKTVAVIGAGISGLAAAYALERSASGLGMDLRVMVFDSAPEVGGKIDTVYRDGFTIERGPDIFLARKPEGIRLCEAIGLGSEIIGTNTDPGRMGSRIYFKGSFYPLPEGLSGLVPARLGPLARSPLLSPAGKMRAALDYVLPARYGDDDESVGAFITRRLGQEAFSRLVDPLLGGIYGGDGDAISLMATFPQLRRLERIHGGILRGLQAAPAVEPAATTPFVSLAGGMRRLPQAVAAALSEVRTGIRVAGISRKGAGYTLELEGARAVTCDAFIAATPSFVSANLLRPWAPEIAQRLDTIPYGSMDAVFLAYDRVDVDHPLDAYGYITPRSEGRAVRACTWMSTKLPDRAPAGRVLLRMFINGASTGSSNASNSASNSASTDPQDDRLVRIAVSEARDVLGITAAPLFHVVQRWSSSMPHYAVGHVDRVAGIDIGLRRHPGCFLAGAAYRGVGIPDCIRDGERAAGEVMAYLPKS